MMRRILQAVATLQLMILPLLANATSMTFEVVDDGVMDEHNGFFMEQMIDGALHETDFLFIEGEYVRWYAYKMSGQTEFNTLPEETYVMKTHTMTVGEFWVTWWGAPAIAEVVGEGDITVPAGNFYCYEVEVREEGTDVLLGTGWFANDVGRIKMVFVDGGGIELSEYVVTGTGFYPLAVGNWWNYSDVTPLRSKAWGGVKALYR